MSKNKTLRGIWDAEKARERVELSGLKRDHIAEQIGISHKTLTAILNGQVPSAPVVKLLAQIIEVDEAEFYKTQAS